MLDAVTHAAVTVCSESVHQADESVICIDVYNTKFPLHNKLFQLTDLILDWFMSVGCTDMFHPPNILVLFIVFILVPLTSASCFPVA